MVVTTSRGRSRSLLRAILAVSLLLVAMALVWTVRAPNPPAPAPAPDRAASAQPEPVQADMPRTDRRDAMYAAARLGPDPESGAAPATTTALLVLDAAGQPVAGATVEICAAEGRHRELPGGGLDLLWLGPVAGPPLLSLCTDAAGLCAVVVERPLAFARAFHDDFGRSAAHAIGPEWRHGDAPVELSLARPVVVRGIVVDARTMPLAGAKLTVACPGVDASDDRTRHQTGPLHAGPDGRFRFEANAGARVMIQADADGDTSMPVTVSVRTGMDEVVVPFRGALRLRGRVLDPAGMPAGGVSVLAYCTADRTTRNTTTDRDGTFALCVDACADYTIAARAALQSSRCASLSVSVRQPQPFVELHLAADQTIEGRVVGPDGHPVPGCVVGASSNQKLAAARRSEEAGADGAFRLTVSAFGTCNVSATAPNWASGWAQAPAEIRDVAPGTRGLRLVLPGPPLTWPEVHGEVHVVSDGSACTAFSVGLVRCGEEAGSSPSGLPLRKPTVSDHRFVLHDVPRGDGWGLRVTARDDRAAPALLPLPDDAPVPPYAAVWLPPWARLAVRVVHDGRPVRGMRVNMVSPSVRGDSHTGTDGEVRFDRVAPGHVVVTVQRFEEQLAECTLDVAAGATVQLVLPITP